MPRLAASTTIACCLCLAAATANAQFFCTPPQELREPDGTAIHLGAEAARLTHFPSPQGLLPRLVYRHRRTDGGHELRLLEGGRRMLFGTPSDVFAILPASALPGFTTPWIDDFAVFDRWLLIAVSDGRPLVPTLVRAPAQVVLVEIEPQARIGAVHVLGSYWSDGKDRVPRIRSLFVDRDPAPDATGPLVSWSVTHDSWQLGAADDVYYCRVGNGGPTSEPQRAYTFDHASWLALTSHVVTEAGRSGGDAQVFVSARTRTAAGTDIGIFAAIASRTGPRAWCDAPGAEQLLDRCGDRTYYLAPGRLGGPRLHAARDAAAPRNRSLSWIHDDTTYGEDGSLRLSRQPGFALAAWPDGEPQVRYGVFESHSGERYERPEGFAGGRYAASDLLLLTADGAPTPLRAVAPVPQALCIYVQAMSENICVVTALPRPDAEFRFADFANPLGEARAFFFHLAR